MKKTILITTMLAILSISVLAIGFSNKENALNYWQIYKSTKDNEINADTNTALISAQFTKDEICVLDYDTGNIDYCYVGFNYTFENKTFEEMIIVSERQLPGNKQIYGEDKQAHYIKEAKKIIKKRIISIKPIEEITYTNTKLDGVIIK